MLYVVNIFSVIDSSFLLLLANLKLCCN